MESRQARSLPTPSGTPLAKPKKYDREKEIRAIARERVGTVQPSRVIKPKTERKRPKHKLEITPDSE